MHILARLAIISLVASIFMNEAKADVDTGELVRSNTSFALDLYREIRSEEGNLFFSPYSISTIMAMTSAGAAGETKQQIASALRLSNQETELGKKFAAIEDILRRQQDSTGLKVTTANALWPKEGFTLRPQFLAVAKETYRATVSSLDYSKPSEAARAINSWVGDKTENLIEELVPPSTLSSLTRLVLSNAIYFKGSWDTEFDPERTVVAPFHVSSTRTEEVPMMSLTKAFRFADLETLQVLELPYTASAFSMLIVLPKDHLGLSSLEAKLSEASLKEWRDRLQTRKLRVSIPKFKMTSTFSLDQALKSLGMINAFDEQKADFSKMSSDAQGLYIATVLHKAQVEVEEEGTEAAAATAVFMAVKSASRPAPVFRADHPFLFLIQDNATGSVLFIGRFVGP